MHDNTMTCTRPDIAYAVGRLGRHISSPGKEHWDAVNRVFKYLKQTMDYGLEYNGDPSVLEGYTDASRITNQEDYASTSKWIFTLGGGAMSWGSKKQSCLTDSTMAAEFVVLTSYYKEAEWLRDLKAPQLENLISEHLVNLHLDTHNIIKQDNKPVSGKGDQLALQLQKLIYEHVANMHQENQKITKTIRKEDKAPQLQKFIVENIEKIQNKAHKIIRGLVAKETHSSCVQFIAAEMGNTKFLIELIRLYPDLIWKVNDENQSIFHITAKYHHEGIYSLLYEIGARKDLITPLREQHDNNMLHLVGMIVNTKGLEDVSITALDMQQELLWFKEVESMIPPLYRERRNSDGLTPHELFRNEHKDMVIQAERWMKEIASQCIIVGALVATMVFAAAFTIPSGYDQNGIPIFHSKTTYKVFVVADDISLFLSSASVLYMFLSLFTSSYC
ncbi:ankyrin repeat-containing domain, PGG domain protein [Tanacetum coccineum]